jgi:hypothetical protein
MSFLIDALVVGGVKQDDITRLEQILDAHARQLHAGRPTEPAGAMFGGSWSGKDLDFQTMRAYEHVRAAIDELVAGLQGYGDNVRKFARDMEDTDTGAGTSLTARRQAIENVEGCTTSGDFHDDNNVCQVPASDGGES